MDSVLASPATRDVFKRIVNVRIAETANLNEEYLDADSTLSSLQDADLVRRSKTGLSYFVTAKGLKVARDLAQLPNGSGKR